MKILCIGRNYAEHVSELNNAKPTEPVVFLKPDTALLKENKPFYIPSAIPGEIHHEIELVVKIAKNGKHIAPQFAHRYFEEVTLGIDFTARDLQQKLKEKGLPWEKAKAFDHSAVIGKWVKVGDLPPIQNLNFNLVVNNTLRQTGNTADMMFDIATIISHLSAYFTLKQGDLIFTGTPKGVGAVAIHDVLAGYLESQELFRFEVK